MDLLERADQRLAAISRTDAVQDAYATLRSSKIEFTVAEWNEFNAELLMVHRVGNVAMLHGSVSVTITKVIILPGRHVQYEVTWLDGRTHNSKQVDEFELSLPEAKQAIGFKVD